MTCGDGSTIGDVWNTLAIAAESVSKVVTESTLIAG